MDHRFEDVAVKQNAIELLELALKRKRRPCMIGTGSMSDPYTPIEGELQMTRRALEVIERYGCGISILTKSDLILRDLDILERINRRSKAVVQMTLTTMDEGLCRLIEPGVCTTQKRVEVLKECQKRGIPTVVWLTPVLPFINDTEENITTILNECARVGVKGVIDFGMGLTLRDGDREYYYAALDRHFPGLKARYIRQYGNAYELPSPNAKALRDVYNRICEGNGLLSTPEECFRFIHEFPAKHVQMSMFDL
jgi:DNA repair photolyase